MRVGYLLCPFLLLSIDALVPHLSRRNMVGSMITMSSIVPGNNNPLKNRFINSSAEENSVSEVGIIQDVNNDVYFYAPVTQRSCFELKNKLMDLDAKSKIFQVQYKIEPPPIHLHIQSEGGSLYHTLYMICLLYTSPSPRDS